MEKAYLIMRTTHDSNYACGYDTQPYMVAFNEELAKQYCKDHSDYKKAPCGCCYEGYDYTYNEIEVLEED